MPFQDVHADLVVPGQGAPSGQLQHGHYYTTSRKIEGAHATPDGRAVGVFCRGQFEAVPKMGPDGKVEFDRVWYPDRIVFLAPDGHDLETRVGRGPLVRVEIPVDKLTDLRPLEEAAHLPEFTLKHAWFTPDAKLPVRTIEHVKPEYQGKVKV